ncbi:MAG: hypothetical protein EXR66_08425 [Dehalococcoidia bacterium]|nr:hypothetical protein [Dehalococcoidia bacterium]
MGLDVYAGTFTRYYSGDWETMVQRVGRELGHDVHVGPRGGPAVELLPGIEAPRHIAQWREEAFADAFDWDEAATLPHLTDKPDWEACISLLLWAAHVEHPKLSPMRPPQ